MKWKWFLILLAFCEGNTLDSTHKGPVMQNFDIYFVVSLNKLLKKHSISQWFEMPLCSCDLTVMVDVGDYHWYSWFRYVIGLGCDYGRLTVTMLKVRSHMRGADAGGGRRKIGFNTNHYMRSHMRGRWAEAEGGQNPLRNKWVQHPIFHIRFETRSPNHLCPQEMADPPASPPRMSGHTRAGGAGMSKSARLPSATTPRMCERSFRLVTDLYGEELGQNHFSWRPGDIDSYIQNQ